MFLNEKEGIIIGNFLKTLYKHDVEEMTLVFKRFFVWRRGRDTALLRKSCLLVHPNAMHFGTGLAPFC